MRMICGRFSNESDDDGAPPALGFGAKGAKGDPKPQLFEPDLGGPSMSRLNFLAPHVRADPYPHYAELRQSAPVCQVDPGGVWAVSRYADVIHVLKNPLLFSSKGGRELAI